MEVRLVVDALLFFLLGPSLLWKQVMHDTTLYTNFHSMRVQKASKQ